MFRPSHIVKCQRVTLVLLHEPPPRQHFLAPTGWATRAQQMLDVGPTSPGCSPHNGALQAPARASEATPPAPLPCDTAKGAQLRVDKCIEDRCGSPRGLVAVAPLHTRRCGTGERERGPVRHCGSGGTPAFHFGRLTRPTPMKMQSEPLARAATRRSPPSERDAERTSPLSTLQLNHIQGCVGATHKLLRSRHNHTAIPLGPAATLGRLHAEVGAEELVNRRLGLRGGAPTARQGLHLGPLVNLLAQHGVSLRYA